MEGVAAILALDNTFASRIQNRVLAPAIGAFQIHPLARTSKYGWIRDDRGTWACALVGLSFCLFGFGAAAVRAHGACLFERLRAHLACLLFLIESIEIDVLAAGSACPLSPTTDRPNDFDFRCH